jgi:branched-subunit amino acid permease
LLAFASFFSAHLHITREYAREENIKTEKMDGSFLAVLFAVLISAFGIENGIFIGVVLLFLYYPLRCVLFLFSLLKRTRCDSLRRCLMMIICFLEAKLRRRRQGKRSP